MARVAVHVAPAICDASIAHGNHYLMDRLGILTEVVPEHCRVICGAQVSCWIALLCVNKMWELGRISDEEDRSVVLH